MKQLYMFALVLITFVAAPNAYAKKGSKGKAAPATAHADILAKYDTNGNGKLEAKEKDALIKDFYTNKTGLLTALDTNNDGMLSSREIAAISGTAKAKGKGKSKGKGKKNK
jgi:hypothetical protein